MVYVALLEDITSVIDCILRYEYYIHYENENIGFYRILKVQKYHSLYFYYICRKVDFGLSCRY